MMKNMNFRRAAGKGLFSVLLLSFLFCFTAFGAEEKEKISSVHLDITSDVLLGEDGGSVEASPQEDQEGYSVTGITITNYPDNSWSTLECPRVEIEVSAENGYKFGGITKSNVKLKIQNPNETDVYRGTVLKTERFDSNGGLRITADLEFQLKESEKQKVGAPSALTWEMIPPETSAAAETESTASGSAAKKKDDQGTPTGKVSWTKGNGAVTYEIRMTVEKKTGEVIGRTQDTSFDLSPYITDPGRTSFAVRSVNKYGFSGSWRSSSTMKITQEEVDTFLKQSDGWKKRSDGWYYYEGGVPQKGWKQADGRWYYLDPETGLMKTGWQEIGGKSYCLDGSTGALYQNTTTPDGYRVDADGAWMH